tara:strand:+ start:3511 stop:4305 length:795 start_codon:yes stop_codon:yes gene_type:complete
MKRDLGVFYTCYKEKEAVIYSLEKLFEVYEDIPVYLVSDGGGDYSSLKDIFPDKKIETVLEEDCRGEFLSFNDENFREPEKITSAAKAVRAFIDRAAAAIEFCDSKHILVMEPDVLVRGKLNIPEDADLLGHNMNTTFGPFGIQEVYEKIEGARMPKCWGATPAIFKTESFIEAKNKLYGTDGLVEKLCYHERQFAYYDCLLSMLFGLISIDETFNPDIIECLRDPYWQLKPNPLVHQYRAKYPTVADGYDSKNGDRDHLLKNF